MEDQNYYILSRRMVVIGAGLIVLGALAREDLVVYLGCCFLGAGLAAIITKGAKS